MLSQSISSNSIYLKFYLLRLVYIFKMTNLQPPYDSIQLSNRRKAPNAKDSQPSKTDIDASAFTKRGHRPQKGGFMTPIAPDSLW